MPAWTVAVSETSSISTISSIPETSSTIPPAYGTAAPMTPEPPPRGTTGTPFAVASFSVAATSSSLVARTTTSGSFGVPCCSAYSAGHDQSLAQRARSPASVEAPATCCERSSRNEADAVGCVTGAFRRGCCAGALQGLRLKRVM